MVVLAQELIVCIKYVQISKIRRSDSKTGILRTNFISSNFQIWAQMIQLVEIVRVKIWFLKLIQPKISTLTKRQSRHIRLLYLKSQSMEMIRSTSLQLNYIANVEQLRINSKNKIYSSLIIKIYSERSLKTMTTMIITLLLIVYSITIASTNLNQMWRCHTKSNI